MTKTWAQKYNDPRPIRKQTDKGMMYISTPKEIANVMQSVPKGRIITTKQIAQLLAKRRMADYTCPLTTGIFVAVVANYMQEKINNGSSPYSKGIAPFWRVVKKGGQLYSRYLGKELPQDRYLKSEGFKLEKKGNQILRVKNFEKYLV